MRPLRVIILNGNAIILIGSIFSCVLVSLLKQNKRKVNFYAVIITTILIPSLFIVISYKNITEYEDISKIIFMVFVPILIGICFVIALVTSFIFQMLWLRKEKN